MEYEFMVICALRGKEISNKLFKDYDSAFNFARQQCDKTTCNIIILYFDKDSKIWKTKFKMFPSETC